MDGWRFQKGENKGAEASVYDDSKWEQVSIPHDWAIAGPFDKDIDKQVVAIEQNGEEEATEKTGRSGSLPWIGEGWYRTSFTTPEGYSHFSLIFDGAMAEPRVYVNGKEAGFWAYGYNTFEIDITPYLNNVGESNTIAVHLQNVEESSRWYPGAGLFRPVRLEMAQEIGIKTWGIFAKTTQIEGISNNGTTAEMARILVRTEIRSDKKLEQGRKLEVVTTILDSKGNKVGEKTYGVNESNIANNAIIVKNPKLWSPEQPILYTLVTELKEDNKIWDSKETKIGIRSIDYSAEGFKLNGQIRKFKGVCLHHDLGPLGAAFNKAAFRRQVRLLKDMGCDAIRTSHNTPAPWQMDICDEMGMMVMAESFDMWVYPKCKNGYSRFFEQVETASPNSNGEPWWKRDITNLVLVNRNHASNVMWSIGNEIPDQGSAIGLKYTKLLQDVIHELDGTRPCTQGMDRGEAPMQSGVWQETDIPGFNYRLHVYHKGLEESAKGFVLGSETASTISSRGVYKFPAEEVHGAAYDDGQISSYDLESCIWSNLPDDDWMYQDKCPWVIGEFVWTGFDYLGEPTPYDEYWPSRSSYFGIYDLAGLPKDRVFLYRTHWNTKDATLHILPHWTWKGREGEITPIFVYTSYPEAELFINGKSQGRLKKTDVSLEDYEANRIEEPMPWGGTSLFADGNAPYGKNRLDRYRMRWMNTIYEPGEVKVVAYDEKGNIAETKIVNTAGKPDHIELIADRSSIDVTPTDANGKATDCPDLSFVRVRVVDKNGNLCPEAANQLNFSVKGAAKFKACCNGDATSTEVFVKPTMKTFHGELVVVVEASKTAGTAILTVSGKGLMSGKATITIK